MDNQSFIYSRFFERLQLKHFNNQNNFLNIFLNIKSVVFWASCSTKLTFDILDSIDIVYSVKLSLDKCINPVFYCTDVDDVCNSLNLFFEILIFSFNF